MNANDMKNLMPGQMIVYNDGRPGHTYSLAVVLDVNESRVVVSFADRADTTTIGVNDREWTDHLSVEAPA